MGQRQLIGKREKALIHVAKTQLGMDDQAYRELLANFGVTSSVELDSTQFEELMRHMKACGFRPVQKLAGRSGLHKAASDKQPMISKIGAILKDFGQTWDYADGIAKRMFGIDSIRWCNSQQTYKVLQALIVYQKRQGCKENEKPSRKRRNRR